MSILCLASIFLIGYGCVYQRRDMTGVMAKLGCKRAQIIRYYIYGGMYLAVVGVFFGSIVALAARSKVFAWVEEVTQSRTKLDLRFSDFSYAMQRKTVEFEPKPGMNHFIWMSIILLFICLTVVLMFSLNISQIEKKGQRQIRRRAEIKIYKHQYGKSSFGFTIRQIMRNRFRTFGIIILGLAITIFGGIIIDAYHTSSNNLVELQKNEMIQGYCVDTKGRIDATLLLSTLDFKDLYENKFFDQVSASANQKIIYWGRSKTKEGNVLQIKEKPSLETEASQMLMIRALMNGMNLYFTSDLSMSPRFIYQKEVRTEFMEGFDESFLKEEYLGVDKLHAMISFDLGEKEGIELGDSITVLFDARKNNYAGYQPMEFQIVGFYDKNTVDEDMYVPLDYFTETSYMRGENLSRERFYSIHDWEYCLNAMTFQLKGLENIKEVKDALEEIGFEEIGTAEMNRKYVLLEDGVLLSNLNNFIIQDQYTRVLVILMVILSVIANIFISNSLVRNRKTDIGVMMGMGATKVQLYIAFVTEVVLMYLLGNVIGVVILEIFVLNLNSMHYIFLGGAAGCFLFGASHALIKAGKNKLIENMKDVKE